MKKMTLTLFLSTGIPALSNAEVGISTHSINSVRTSFSVRIQKLQDLDSNEISVYPSLQTLLDLYGAKIDLQSKVKIHEENSHIDFSCFDCVIRNYDSFNREGGDRG